MVIVAHDMMTTLNPVLCLSLRKPSTSLVFQCHHGVNIHSMK